MLPSLIFDKSNLLREICKSWEQPPVYFGTKRRWQSVWKLENFINLSLFRYLNVLELTSRHLTVTNNFGSWALVVQPLPATSYMPLAQMLKIRGNKNTPIKWHIWNNCTSKQIAKCLFVQQNIGFQNMRHAHCETLQTHSSPLFSSCCWLKFLHTKPPTAGNCSLFYCLWKSFLELVIKRWS